jgi:tetratricopeptide (TPR) repeat protein
MLEEALSFDRETGDLRGQSICLGLLGYAHFSLGQMKRAIEFYEQDLALARKIGDTWGESICLSWLARTLIATGEFSKAYELGLQVLELKMPDTVYSASLVLGIVKLHWHNPSAADFFKDTVVRCQSTLKKTGQLYYDIRYILGTALVGKAVCDPHWNEVHKQKELLAPALVEYQYALDICDARGVVQSTLRDLEVIQAAGVEGLEPVFELLEAKLV